MRKLSILALVVILVSALSLVGYSEVSDQDSVNVHFKTTNTISLTVTSGEFVEFGNGLDPTNTHFEMRASTLNVTSTKNNWEVTHNITGTATGVLSIGYGTVSSTSNWGNLDTTATGDSGSHEVTVNYRLDNLETLEQRNNSLNVMFTVSA